MDGGGWVVDSERGVDYAGVFDLDGVFKLDGGVDSSRGGGQVVARNGIFGLK